MFDDSQELEVGISLSSCRNTPFTLSADITAPPTGTPGQPPYSVSWYWNTSGIFYPTSAPPWATGPSLTLTEHPNCPVYWVKCVVTSSDNVVRSRVRRVDLSLPMCMACAEADRPSSAVVETGVGNSGIQVFPNPASSDEVQVVWPGRPDASANFQILDVSGRAFRTGTCQFDGTGTAPLHVESLPQGAYSLSLSAPHRAPVFTKLLILKH